MPASEPRLRAAILATLLAAVCLFVAPAYAENAQADGAKRTLAKAQALLKQVNAQKAAAEAALAKAQAEAAEKDKALAKLKGDLKSRDADLKGAEGSLAAAKQRGEALDSQLGSTRDRLEKTEAKLRELIEKYKAQAQTLQETRQAKADLESRLGARERELADAIARNKQLYETNAELIERYRKKGVFDALLQREPLTGLKSVDTENIMQDYQERAEDARLDQNAK